MNLQRLHDILSLKRGHNSVGERMLCDMLVSYGMDALRDPKTGELLGYFMTIGDSRTLFTAHTDTVHYSKPGSDDVRNAYISMFDGTMLCALNAPLGADDGAGVWLLLEMIDAGVPGAYLFARGEECGGIGSRGIARHHANWLKRFDRCISFDRRGTHSVITHQSGIRCCSDEFAEALASALTDDAYFYAPDNTGVFTDSANFTSVIAECTNVSVGYYDEHSPREQLDLNYLLSLRRRCIDLDWESLPTVRRTVMRDEDISTRLARVESRLVQLMIYLGADPRSKHGSGEFFDLLVEEIDAWKSTNAQVQNEESRITAGGDSVRHEAASNSCDKWAALEEPTYIRRRRERTIVPSEQTQT